MSIQPQQTPAGWYPQGTVLRYWDGAAWTQHTQPVQGAAAPMQVTVNAGGGPRAMSGLSTGMNLVHLILTVCTAGLWGIVWFLHARLSRRKFIY